MKRGNILKTNRHVIQGHERSIRGQKPVFFVDNSKTKCPFGLEVDPL